MAQRLSTSKAELIGAEAQDAAARLALGETQILAEIREFLTIVCAVVPLH